MAKTTKTINLIMALEEAQRFLERSDLPIDRPHDAISEAIRVLEAVGALHTMLFDYEVWVLNNHPDNHDGQDVMTYEQFDEQRADWHESIVRQASVVTGSLFPPEKASA